MDNRDIYRTAAAALERGQPLALVTVISTIGSTPGKVGYQMLVFEKDRGSAGTVGGGLVEARMIEEGRNLLGEPRCRLFRFDLGSTPEDDKGICGGSVELLIETFDKTALPLFEEIVAAADRAEGGVLVSLISSDGLPRKIRLASPEQIEAIAGNEPSREVTSALQEVASTGGAALRVSAGDVDVFIESLAQAPAVVLFGAGHVSYHIARFAKAVHFRVIVCDDRREYANPGRFPDADGIVVADFGRVFDKVRIDRDSYLVIVTRGHKCDQTVLEQAVKTNARYIGMIGSKRKTSLLLEKLRHGGVPQDVLERIYSPIGLSLGAVTAEEIALSIVSELVKVRRLGEAAPISHLTLGGRGEVA